MHWADGFEGIFFHTHPPPTLTLHPTTFPCLFGTSRHPLLNPIQPQRLVVEPNTVVSFPVFGLGTLVDELRKK